ncbi:helix-turn-helix transcriptional regulator [Pinirhizobacter sp.]|jgi:DNA-binding CsgD family transcriptional regulator|uniref:helix-turn-helix transcriptional regulator n=1 Tax=Pinirhizobacter sp. TaxID=2950432 RepID=UPI002F3E89E3
MTRVVDPSLRMLFDQMPGLWGCKDENSVFMYANPAYAKAVGVKQHQDMIGSTDFDTPCDTAACAGLFQAQDKEVMVSTKPLKILDIHPFAGGEWCAYLFTKTPLIQQGEIIGTIFHGMDITSARTLELGSLLGRIRAGAGREGQVSYLVGDQAGSVDLSPREAEVLFFLIRGKRVKDIAVLLDLSPRTIEQHVATLRHKFSATSQYELIDQAINSGYLDYIPERLFKQQMSVIVR